MKVFTTYLDQNMMINTKKNNNNNIDTKPPNVFNCLKTLTQKAKDLIDEREDANDDIDDGSFFLLVITNKNLTQDGIKFSLSYL